MQYVAKQNTYATGQVTGRHYTLRQDHIIEAPAGEFDHLHHTRIREAEEEEEVDLSPPDTGIHEVGGGWWEVYVDGEIREKVQGEESAQERLEELTLPEDRENDAPEEPQEDGDESVAEGDTEQAAEEVEGADESW